MLNFINDKDYRQLDIKPDIKKLLFYIYLLLGKHNKPKKCARSNIICNTDLCICLFHHVFI